MSKAIEVARYAEKSKSHSHHQLEGDQGDLTGGNMLDWCGSGEETGGGNLYLSMELLKGLRWLRLGRLGMALPQIPPSENQKCIKCISVCALTQQDWKIGTGLKGVWVTRVIEREWWWCKYVMWGYSNGH